MREHSDIVFHEPCPFYADTCVERTETSVPDLQERIIRHSSPTLAGLKCGSMFKVCSDLNGIAPKLEEIDEILSRKGVRVVTLRSNDTGMLLYVFRPKLLSRRIDDPEIRGFLRGHGYASDDPDDLVEELRGRFSSNDGIPPEIGVFLDYPIEDIRGYIENNGRSFRCIGCWKVYGDVELAERKFDSYRRCRDIYHRRFSEGFTLERLTVRC